MKSISLLASLFVLALMLGISPVYAQKAGKAASPQKQANLEKNKAHQAELRAKYNAMTPEQKAEARKEAKAYKSGGYKTQSAPAYKTAPASNPAAKPAEKAKPVLMDANGKPLNQNPAPGSKPVSAKPAQKSAASENAPAPVTKKK
jgi:hypothetical protein